MKLIVILGVITIVSSARKREGDSCKLVAPVTGVCRQFSDCQSAKDELENTGRYPVPCNVHSTDLYCCEEQTSQEPVQRETRSSLKCKEYSLWKPSPIFSNSRRIQGQCGALVETFILGGSYANALEFPHMARIGMTDKYTPEPEYTCGGSLISEYFVLTAAHCLYREDLKVTHVKLGVGDYRSTKVYEVSEVIPHERHVRNKQYYDIALIKLKEKVVFTDYKRPACLQQVKDFTHSAAVASGWGVDSTGRPSTRLLKTKIPFVQFNKCNQEYNPDLLSGQLPHGLEEDTMLCGGGFGTGNDTCQGDSGGPLQNVLKSPPCMYNLLGVTSFGLGECGQKAPGVYTRVSAYLNWIERIVWP